MQFSKFHNLLLVDRLKHNLLDGFLIKGTKLSSESNICFFQSAKDISLLQIKMEMCTP